MDEYIKREHAVDAVLDVYCDTPDIDLSCEKFEAAILKIQAADVYPVRHGRWNADETCPFCGEKSTEGLDAEKWGYWFPAFCPNCGAKMDVDDLED